MTLNIVLPIVYAAINLFQIYCLEVGEPIPYKWVIYLPYSGMGVMQLISFVLLGYGVFKIRSLILQNNKGDLNQHMIILHLVCFGLWTLLAAANSYETISPKHYNFESSVVFFIAGTVL